VSILPALDSLGEPNHSLTCLHLLLNGATATFVPLTNHFCGTIQTVVEGSKNAGYLTVILGGLGLTSKCQMMHIIVLLDGST
jgi:hypothetical protein